MKFLAGVASLVGLSLFAACGGAASTDLFDSADASASSTSSSSSSNSSSSSTSSGGVVDAGKSDGAASSSSGSSGTTACIPGPASTCPNGTYCEATNCSVTTGKCTPKPILTNTPNPVCGCDGVTYYNSSLAANVGASTKATGQCSPTAPETVKCGGNGRCQGKQFCSLGHASVTTCGNDNAAATNCWILPDACNASETKSTRQCPGSGGGAQCGTLCSAIRTEKDFYLDAQGCL